MQSAAGNREEDIPGISVTFRVPAGLSPITKACFRMIHGNGAANKSSDRGSIRKQNKSRNRTRRYIRPLVVAIAPFVGNLALGQVERPLPGHGHGCQRVCPIYRPVNGGSMEDTAL
jgi:hypothetical protein